MVISQEEKYIFIHIPKTAGTFLTHGMQNGTGVCLESIVDRNGSTHEIKTHAGALQLKTIFGEAYDHFFSFAFVRNPWDRMVSLYNFKLQSAQLRVKGKRPLKPGISREDDMKEIAYLSTLGFERWLLEGDCDSSIYGESLTRLPQLCWLTDQDGNLIVSHVARFEDLQPELEKLQDRFKMKFEVQTGNSSIHAPWQLYYSQETFSCVKERFHADITMFGYQIGWDEVEESKNKFPGHLSAF